MAQGSIPWDDQQGGDGNPGAAVFDSNYLAAEWHRFFSAVYGSDATAGFIMPGVYNDLEVTERGAGANMSVDVASGAAFVNGVHYQSTATENLIVAAADPANPRLDRVILRVTRGATQTVRLAVLTGVAAAAPALPALTQTAALFEIDVAHVYVRAATASILDEDISDKRVFAPNFFGSPNLLNENCIRNSEYMAFPALQNYVVYPPCLWALVNTPTNFAQQTRPAQMSRGRAVQITSNAADEGMQQQFPVRASTHYVIKALIWVTAGDVGKIIVTTDSAAPGTITREVRRTESWLEETIHYNTEADASLMTVQLLCANNGDIIRFGQVLSIQGYHPGPFRQIHEHIPFQYDRLSDAAWSGVAKGAGTTTIDLDADFGAYILEGTSGVDLQVGASHTATGNIMWIQAAPGLGGLLIDIRPLVAGVALPAWTGGSVSLNQNNQFDVSRTGNLTAHLYITGIVI